MSKIIIAMKKTVIVFLVISMVLSMKATSVYAAYAYSIGTNHGNSVINLIFGRLDGDFTDNVLYSSTCYGTMNNITSYYNLQPTPSYMRGYNPNGNRRIASRIVFLNGHANYDNIVFAHNNESDYKTGVYMGEDMTSSSTGFSYVGLQSTDMSTCKLISFVGCCTAGNGRGDNLLRRAVSSGAKVAVGFREEITSRTSDGKGWLRKYNDSIALGSSVSQSIRNAVDTYPNHNMSSCVSIAGTPSTAFSSISTSMYANSYTSRIDVSSLENVKAIKADEWENEEIIDLIKLYDKSFEPSHYEVTINMFDEKNGDGVIIFNYVINHTIQTNKAYICHIENSYITKITTTKNANQSEENKTVINMMYNDWVSERQNALFLKPRGVMLLSKMVDEDQLLQLVEQHKAINNRTINSTKIDLEEIKSIDERYYYDYYTGKLTFENVVYKYVDDVIVDYCNVEELN